MANLKISELPKVDLINNDFEFAVVDTDNVVTSKVTITGMTFDNGVASRDSLNGIADLATPLTLSGDGVEFVFTADTITVRKYENRVATSVFIVYSADSPTTLSTFYVDIAGDSSTSFYLPYNSGGWSTVSITPRPLQALQGDNTIELRMTLENGVTFNFAQVYISGFEL